MRYICGGIGDFIQSYDSIQQGEKVKVFTHFKKAKDFFTHIDADFEFHYFDSVGDLSSINEDIKKSGEEVNREIFQKFLSLPPEKINKALKKADELDNIIGIHPVGSKLSNDFWSSVGKPEKRLPPWFVRAIIQENKNYFIFGTTEELKPYKELMEDSENVTYIDHEDIWDSLCHVLCCEKVIAIDSCIKSMSCAKKIQTLIFVGDYEDEYRDKNFIQPYIAQMVMRAIPFNIIERRHVKLAKEFQG
tara:strand:- start:2671 stop:3411 length:741 start_codon:yes stop_codon:yes gene_type:complete